jgi:SAM-dependent methyltransferase
MFRVCNLCGTKDPGYNSLNDLQAKLSNFGFPYAIKEFETLSYKHYACKKCGSSDRDRLYKLYIEKYLIEKEINLVDFAPSPPLRDYLKSKNNITYRFADLMMLDVDDRVDITDMKIYNDNIFDFFICSHILEHVRDDVGALNELFRILKPGGKGILMTPIVNKNGAYDEDIYEKNTSERWRRFAQDDHVRLYDKKVFVERVKSAGFSIEEFNFIKLGLCSIIKNGISLRSKLYIVKKLP